jgi:hypothetical protein
MPNRGASKGAKAPNPSTAASYSGDRVESGALHKTERAVRPIAFGGKNYFFLVPMPGDGSTTCLTVCRNGGVTKSSRLKPCA